MKLHLFLFFFVVLSTTTVYNASGQTQATMDFEQYDPVSTLVVPRNPVKAAKYPFVDVHNHQRNMDKSRLNQLVSEMDKLNMAVMVNLSGGNGNSLQESTQNAKASHPGRFIVFANVDFDGVGRAGWIENAVRQLEQDVKSGGAKGLKIYKNLGFSVMDATGKRVTVDDNRLDPIWKKCGELRIPVLIHTADPKPFWDDMDKHNERWLELATHPRRKRSNTDPVPFEQLIAEQHRLFKKHPGTTFIAAHFGWFPNDLAKLGQVLNDMPNVVVEFGAVIAELGRQPRQAAAFFTTYQDRILFGKDSWVPAEYGTYFRVLETADEYFPYHKKYHAFWPMYGMNLPDEILKKIYYKNALRIIPGLDKTLFPK